MRTRRFLRATVAAAALLVVGAFVVLQLPWSPVRSIVVAGPSMQPTLHGGDVVVTAQRRDYRRGAVVAFRIPSGEPGAGKLVIHRIVGGDGTRGYLVRGDNREGIDPWRPRTNEVVGEATVVVPRVGLMASLLRTPLGMASLAALVTVLSIGWRRVEPASE